MVDEIIDFKLLNCDLGFCSFNRPFGQVVMRLSLAASLRFKSWAGQIGNSVANVSLPLRHFLNGAVLHGRSAAEVGPANSFVVLLSCVIQRVYNE